MREVVKQFVIEVCNKIDEIKLTDCEVREFLTTLQRVVNEVQKENV